MVEHINSIFKTKKRKGNVALDIIMVLVSLVVFTMFILVGQLVFNNLNDDIQTDTDMSNFTKDIVSTEQARYSSIFDSGFIVVFVLLWVLILFASFRIDTHPIFFIFSVILLLFAFTISMTIGNTYEDFTADEDITDLTTDYPMMNWVMSNLLIVAIVMGFSVVLVLYGRSRFIT